MRTSPSGQVTAHHGQWRIRHAWWRSARFLLLLTPLPLLLGILWLIWERTTDTPLIDEWETVTLVQKFDQGTLGIKDFWAIHAAHRIVLPRIISLILIEATHWNRQIEMTFNLAIAVASAALIFLCVRRTFRSTDAMLLSIAPLSLLLFTLAQFENWLLPFQVTFFTTVLGVAFCLWALTIQPVAWRNLALAMLGALIASLSSLGGLAVWLVFLPALWIAGYRRIRYFAIWLAAAAAVIVPYALHYTSDQKSGSPLNNPLAATRYALTYLGAPAGSLGIVLHTPTVARSEWFAVASILFMLGNLIIYFIICRDHRPLAPWLGLALFALAGDALTVYGRGAVLSATHALTPRYQIFSTLWWVAVFVVSGMATSEAWKNRRSLWGMRSQSVRWGVSGVNLAVVTAMCIGIIQVNIQGFRDGRVWLDDARRQENCVIDYRTASDRCLTSAYLNYDGAAEFVRNQTAFLNENHLAIFHRSYIHKEDLMPTTQATKYSIDTVGEAVIPERPVEPIRFLQGSLLTVRGWAVDSRAAGTAGGVFISIDNEWNNFAYCDIDRPDVARALHNGNYAQSGFTTTFDTGKLPIGEHTIAIAILTKDRKAYYEPAQRIQIEVKSVSQLQKLVGAPPSSIDSLSSYTVAPITVAPTIVGQSYQVPLAFPFSYPIYVNGWAVDEAAHGPAGAVLLSIDDTINLPTEYGLNRTDVTAVLGDAYLASGWQVTITAGLLAPGNHMLTIRIVSKDLGGYYESSQRVGIVIQP